MADQQHDRRPRQRDVALVVGGEKREVRVALLLGVAVVGDVDLEALTGGASLRVDGHDDRLRAPAGRDPRADRASQYRP